MSTRNVLEAYGSDIIGSHVEVGTGGHEILNPSGTSMTQEEKMQFTGNVTVTDDSANGKTVVNIDDSGHTIKNSSGTAMTQQPNMKFADSFVTNDLVGEATVVENIKEHTTASDYENATEDGIHVIDDGNDVPIGASSEDKVEVVADGNKTYQTLLNELYDAIDVSKLTRQAILYKGDDNFWFALSRVESDNTIHFGSVMNYGSYFRNFAIELNDGDSKYMRIDTQNSGNTITNNSSAKPTQGTKLTLYYGTSSTVINLLTDARHCMMSDGVTSVESALGGLKFKCEDVTFTFSNSSASNPVSLSSITDIPFNKIKYINFLPFGVIGVFNGTSNGTEYYCSNFLGTAVTGDILAKCLIVYEA